MNDEHCPKCNTPWVGDCPKDPWWIEYYCENPSCKYGVGENSYTRDRLVIRDSELETEHFWIQVRKEQGMVNIGSIEGYGTLTDAFQALKEMSRYYVNHHCEIISRDGKVVNSGRLLS